LDTFIWYTDLIGLLPGRLAFLKGLLKLNHQNPGVYAKPDCALLFGFGFLLLRTYSLYKKANDLVQQKRTSLMHTRLVKMNMDDFGNINLTDCHNSVAHPLHEVTVYGTFHLTQKRRTIVRR